MFFCEQKRRDSAEVSHQANRLCLSVNVPVTPVLRLPIDLGVEVHVMQDHSVSTREIQALSSRSCGQQEDEDFTFWVVEGVHDGQPLLHLCECCVCE